MHLPLSGDDVLALHNSVLLERLNWLPDSSRLICKAQFTGQPEFWSIDPVTGRRNCLTVGANGQMPAVSPSGSWLSAVERAGGVAEIWLWPLSPGLGSMARKLTNLGVDINSASWAPDEGSIVFACNRTGTYNIYEVSVPDGIVRRVGPDSSQHMHYPVYSPDGRSIVFVHLSESWEDHEVLQIDRTGGIPRVVARDYDFFDYQFGRRFGYPIVSPNGKHLLFRSHSSNWINYVKVELTAPKSGGIAGEPLAPESYDQGAESGSVHAGDAAWSPDSRQVAYISNRDGIMQLRVVPSTGGDSVVVAAAEEGVVCHPAWSPDGRHLAFILQSFTSAPDVWVVEVDRKESQVRFSDPRQLTHSTPDMVSRKLIKPERVRFKTFDGQLLHGYLYRPREPAPRPAIVQVQGGPVDQFRDMVDVFAQYFSSRGYICFLVQRRGSMGFGKKFEDGIRGAWGVDDLKDLIAGARYLVDQGLAQPDRVGLTGESYGGYMSMFAAVAAPRGVFAAIVSRTGYADWGHYLRYGHQRTVKLLTHSMGPYETNESKYAQSAALNKASLATAPIFVVDEDSDPTSPHPDLRAEFVRALRRYDKPVRYERYSSTGGPGVRSEAGAKRMLPDVEQFFRQYLG